LKITNNHGAPATLVALANKNHYSKGAADYSITELLSPPRVRRLRERHDARLEQDVSDMLWSLLGSALHVVAERASADQHVTEERIFAEIDGVKVSGAIDLQEMTEQGVIITDYKFTSAYSVMNEKKEWEEQLNLYKWLVESRKRIPVIGLRICALIRDFSRHDRRENYPASPIHMVEIPMWDSVKAEAFVRARLHLHAEAKFADAMEEPLPPCSDEERWFSETTYAVKKEGRKTAVRVFKTIEEAKELAQKEKGYVETRAGEPRRCTGNYCNVAEYCDQYQSEVSAGLAET
jgi:hypothetical protein